MSLENLVHVIDDDEAMRDSLAFLLQSAKVGARTYDTASAFLEMLNQISGGCVVTDVRMPGMSGIATHMMSKKMDALDIPPIHEFIEMIGDTGCGMFACKASVDMFGMSKDDFVEQVQDIITVGDFYELAAGGQIIFT